VWADGDAPPAPEPMPAAIAPQVDGGDTDA
jgi:hypothetical protein